MFRRGKDTSGAPICSGTIALAKPAKSGVAKSNNMIVPCMVKLIELLRIVDDLQTRCRARPE